MVARPFVRVACACAVLESGRVPCLLGLVRIRRLDGYLMPSPPPATPSPTRRCPRASGQRAPRQRHHRCPQQLLTWQCFEVGPHTVGVTVAHLPCKVSHHFRAVCPVALGVTKAGRTLVAQRAACRARRHGGVAVVGADAEGFVASTAVGGTHDSTPRPNRRRAPAPTVPSKCRG